MATLAAASLDCGGKVVFEESGGASSSQPNQTSSGPGNGGANACAAACKQSHPEGFDTFNITNGGCVCDDCSAACDKRVCDNKKVPSDECLACVQTSIKGDECQNHQGLFGVCRDPNNAMCGAYTACLLACQP